MIYIPKKKLKYRVKYKGMKIGKNKNNSQLFKIIHNSKNQLKFKGATDCTPPWMTQKNPFYTKILSKTVYRCPSLFGDSNKVYCCYNTDGDVECCDFQEYFIFK